LNRARAFDEAVDRQRPTLSIEPRHAEMTQEEDGRGGRHSIEHLLRRHGIALDRALRIEPHGIAHSLSL
jgi:hypothetical protein